MPQTVQKNDKGTRITLIVSKDFDPTTLQPLPWDISSASSKEIEIQLSNQQNITYTASFDTGGGTDGRIYAIMNTDGASDLTVGGRVKARALLTVGSWEGSTTWAAFTVEDGF